MIARNLGNIERLIRLTAGLLLAAWALTATHMSPIEWLVLLVSLFLILNGVFSRCYFWYVLDINSCKQTTDQRCSPRC
jgi:Flp pilus assembly protein TadB